MAEHIFMDSKVEIIGYLTKSLTRGFRLIRCVSGDPLHNIETDFEVPLVYWTRSTRGNRLTSIPQGKKIKLIGRLDYDKEYLLCVVVENFEIIEEGI